MIATQNKKPLPDGRTLPGWRDFERTVALAFAGIPSESKDIFDVRLQDSRREDIFFGISCKMKNALRDVDNKGRAYIELSNSSGEFWDHLHEHGITAENWRLRPKETGCTVVNLVSEWHNAASFGEEGDVDVGNSCFLTLSYDNKGSYQLHQFQLSLPNPKDLEWECPGYPKKESKSIVGSDEAGKLFDWYGISGGQLKYYPLVTNAKWKSEKFQLEALPGDRDHGILRKASDYFPDKWAAVHPYPSVDSG